MHRRWRVVLAVAVACLALVASVLGIAFAVYAHTYQPLQPGSFFVLRGLHAQALTDGFHDTRMIVIGPAGTQARVEYSLENSGSRPVRILGVQSNSGIDRAQWGPFQGRGQLLGGSPQEARNFPMTLPAHSQVSLWIYVTQPDCSHGAGGTLTGIPIRWSALGVHHVYDLALDGDEFLPVTICPPRSAFRHIDQR
jgi:hypothetical protein